MEQDLSAFNQTALYRFSACCMLCLTLADVTCLPLLPLKQFPLTLPGFALAHPICD